MKRAFLTNGSVMVGALCAALSAGAPASAADAPADAAVAQQRALYERGNKLYDEKKWREAEAAYLEAWAIKQSYDLAANLADVELELGKTRDAAEHLAYALRAFPVGGKPALRQALAKRFEEIRQLVGSVRVEVGKPGAEVLVDGRSIGYAPIEDDVFVEPGARVVEARLEGYAAARETIAAGKGTRHEVRLTLARAEPVKGDAAGPVGGPGGRGAAMPQDAGPSWVWIGAGAAATAVLAGTGVVFAMVSGGKASDADAARGDLLGRGGPEACRSGAFAPGCEDLQGLNDGSDTFRNLAVGSFLGAGIVGVATAAYALWPRAGASAPAGLRIAPAVGGGGRGVVVTGTF